MSLALEVNFMGYLEDARMVILEELSKKIGQAEQDVKRAEQEKQEPVRAAVREYIELTLLETPESHHDPNHTQKVKSHTQNLANARRQYDEAERKVEAATRKLQALQDIKKAWSENSDLIKL
jgi:hypothetical protein